MSRTSIALLAVHVLLAAVVVGWLTGYRLGRHVGEQRTVVCTQFCQRVAGDEYGLLDLDGDCTCYGDVRALAAELDHRKTDTGWTGGDR